MVIQLTLKPLTALAGRLEETRTIADVPKINGSFAPVLGVFRELVSDPVVFEESCTPAKRDALRDAIEYASQGKVQVSDEELMARTVAEYERLTKLHDGNGDDSDLKTARRFIRRLRWCLYTHANPNNPVS